MKYNVGDKVRIKSLDWYNENKASDDEIRCYPCWFGKEQSKWCGKVMTITHVKVDYYIMSEDMGQEEWTDEMIEGLVKEETKPKFKVGDKITNGKVTLTILTLSSDRYVVEDNFGECGTLYFNSQDEWKIVEEESEKKLSNESWRYKNIFDPSQYPQSFECPDGYIFKDENGNIINTQKIVLEKKGSRYPKTYEECSTINGCEGRISLSIIGKFTRLINARNAYWRIAGQEMGLGKPWKPDWTNQELLKHCIANVGGQIKTAERYIVNTILAFPTEEMRDAFYEVFREEIEICKEFL